MTASIRRSGWGTRLGAQLVLLALVFVLAWLFASMRLPGVDTAPWWPAAGVAVIAVIAARGHRIAVVTAIFAVSALANMLAGTDPAAALGFGLANAVEAWIVAYIALESGERSPLLGPGQVGRLLIAVTAGALGAGIVAAFTVVAMLGGDGFETFVNVTGSHASASLIIAPFALVPLSAYTPKPLGEFVVQFAALVLVVAWVFIPGQLMPLSFLPFPLLAWAAFRFGTGLVAVETFITIAIVAVLSFLGGGPFAQFELADEGSLVELLQVYTLSLAVSMLLLSALQNDRRGLITRLNARQRLLRGGIVNAHAGFLLAEEVDADHYPLLESNPVADEIFGPWLAQERDGRTIAVAQGPLQYVLAELDEEHAWTGEIEFAGGLVAEITALRLSGTETGDVLIVQALDVTERRRAETALTSALENERQSAERLRELNRQKDDFVSSVSHELRTPITSILGYAEELREAEPTPEQEIYVDVMLRNARRLSSLVDDLLAVSRVTSGSVGARRVPLDLVDALRETMAEVAPIARDRGVDLDFVPDVDGLPIETDPDSVARITLNLLSNAIKFTPASRAVRMTLHLLPDRARVEVIDEGTGIAPAELERVFERFYRTQRATDSAVPGTGLGLPIVRALAQQVGGRVFLESDGHSGTTAIVEFPLDPHVVLDADAEVEEEPLEATIPPSERPVFDDPFSTAPLDVVRAREASADDVDTVEPSESR